MALMLTSKLTGTGSAAWKPCLRSRPVPVRASHDRWDRLGGGSFVREGLGQPHGLFSAPAPRLSERALEAMRLRHFRPRTEQAYLGWMRRYHEFHGRRNPAELGPEHVTVFRNALATRGHVAASTQHQALAALLIKPELTAHLGRVRAQHERDLVDGARWVELPGALAKKLPSAGREWTWQWVFPATRTYVERETGEKRRHHLHETVVQHAIRRAVLAAGIPKRATCHTFRHSSPRTSSKPAATSAPCRSCSATRTSPRR